MNVIRANYSKNERWPRPDNSHNSQPTTNVKQEANIHVNVSEGAGSTNKKSASEVAGLQIPNTVRRLVFPLTDGDGDERPNTDEIIAVTSKEYQGMDKSNDANDGEKENMTVSGEKASKTEDDEDEDVKNLNVAGRNALAAVYNNLGNLKRQEGRNFSEALSAYEKSLRVGGENAVVYNNLALLHICSNRLEDAGKMLDHALKLDPKLDCAVSNRLKLSALIQKRESSSDGRAYDDFEAFGVNFDNDGGTSRHEVEDDEEDLMDLGEEEQDGDGAMNQDDDEDDDDDERMNEDNVEERYESEGGDSGGHDDASWDRRQHNET